MSALLAYRATGPGPLWAWTPDVLGVSLLAWWDAERPDLITHSGGAVSSWKDIIGGYDLAQATGANQPTYDATGAPRGAPCVTGNGTSQCLELTGVPAGIPTGETPCETWLLLNDTSQEGDFSSRTQGGWGGTSAANSRRILSNGITLPGGGLGRKFLAVQGNGASSSTSNSDVNIRDNGWHVVRVIASSTLLTVEVDGIANTPVASTPAIATTRMRLFASTATVANAFHLGSIAACLITGLQTDGQATLLRSYLSARAAP